MEAKTTHSGGQAPHHFKIAVVGIKIADLADSNIHLFVKKLKGSREGR
jgi:hypothetical protein